MFTRAIMKLFVLITVRHFAGDHLQDKAAGLDIPLVSDRRTDKGRLQPAGKTPPVLPIQELL